MVLSFLNYGFFVFLFVYAIWYRYRASDSMNSWLIFFLSLCGAAVALGAGVAMHAALFYMNEIALFFAKLSTCAMAACCMILLLLSFTFPYERKAKVLRLLAVAFWVVICYFIVKKDSYIQEVSIVNSVLTRTPGDNFFMLSRGIFILGGLSAMVLFLRRLVFKSMIYRLQTAISIVGLVAGIILIYLLGVALPERWRLGWVWMLQSVGWLLIILVLGFASRITRLFDVRASFLQVLSFTLYAVVLGIVSGIAFVLPFYVFKLKFFAAFLLAAAVFLLSERVGTVIRKRFAEFLRSRGAYGERLDAALAKLDFSTGRDEVIAKLLEIIKDIMGCASVNLFIEDTAETLVNVGSTNGKTESFSRKGQAIDLLLNEDISIVLKTEIVSNYEYHDVKTDLLTTMDKYDADALILLREGRTVTGAIMLGAKLSGADFTDYDYSVLSKVYGKLFVVAYYLKNIAQESLVVTVDRELEFSEQIIQSIQENVDRIEYPGIDISYTTQSTRKSGGDFIDVIRLTENRFIFVIGDVSGKGLNASMSMVILKSVIRTFLKETKDFKKLVVKTNAFVKANLPKGTFFAGVFGLFDFADRSLYYINCGVPTMLLLSSAYNNPVEIQGDGKVLGFLKDITGRIAVRKATFKTDDTLLITTDGLTDAESLRGTRFGKERIQASLLENRLLPAERIVQNLTDSVKEFVSQEMTDDITILAVKFLAQ